MIDKGKVTIYQIAKEAQVSPATVSRILTGNQRVSEDKRSRVEKAIKDNNFTPNVNARKLSGGEAQILGFILPDITNPYFNNLFAAAEERAAQLGYSMLLANTLNDNNVSENRQEIRFLHQMRDKQVDGILITGGHIQDVNLSKEYEKEFKTLFNELPLVTLGSNLSWIDCPSVDYDEPYGIQLLVDYLVSQGHRDIGFLGGITGIQPTDQRLKYIKYYLNEHNLSFHEEYHIEGSGFSIEAGQLAMTRLLELKKKPTAVICLNDLTAMGALHEAHQRGVRVPDDLSITGIDNILYGQYVTPSLTTINLRQKELGRLASEMMINLLSDEPVDRHITIKPNLIIRNSCGTIKN